MDRYVMFTHSNAVAGQEAAFNDWYDRVHLPEILSIPGFVAAQRYVQETGLSEGPGSYLAVYEIETADLAATLAQMGKSAPSMTVTPAINQSSVVMHLYRVLGDRQVAPK